MIQQKPVVEHIYIHVPFCLKKCGYCSFFSVPYSDKGREDYFQSLIHEISLFKRLYSLNPKTIYFGGGTPSLLSVGMLKKILTLLVPSNSAEIILEANPSTISQEFAYDIASVEINRVSLGAQSMDQAELKLLGRIHNVNQVKEVMGFLRKAGFDNISLDLIYGLPNQKLSDVEFSLNELIALKPQHISTYCLSLEKDVPLYSCLNEIPKDKIVAEFYNAIREILLKAGFEHYEISNFCRLGKESQHNSSYWDDKSYLGLGPAAAGYIANFTNIAYKRYNNPASLADYTKLIDADKLMAESETLTESQHESEFIFLQLRKTKGIDLVKFMDTFGFSFVDKYKDKIQKFQNLGLMKQKNGFCFLTPTAYFISNEIMSEFC